MKTRIETKKTSEAVAILDRTAGEKHGVGASFSRALLEGLSAQQSDSEFNAMLAGSIQSIFEASTVKRRI